MSVPKSHHTRKCASNSAVRTISPKRFAPVVLLHILTEHTLTQLSSAESFLREVREATRTARSEPEFARLFLNAFEKTVSNLKIKDLEIRMEERLIKGRTDARVGYVIFEFEMPGKLEKAAERDKSYRELTRHLEESSEKRIIQSEKSLGIVTDGVSIAFVEYDQANGKFGSVDEYERFIPVERAYRPIGKSLVLFDRILVGLTWRELSPDNLRKDFGPGSPICKAAMRALWDAFETSQNEPRIKAFYETWKLLFSLSTKKVTSGGELANAIRDYGIDPLSVRKEEDVRRFLYLLHTYYALILKMLAFKIQDDLFQFLSIIKQIQSDPSAGLRAAEESFPRLAVNVVEKDVFSWFEDAWSLDISGALKTIAERIDRYDVRGVRTDVLKRVYQNLVPEKLRKSLGEFYTKNWTAKLILDEMQFDGKGTILDPACGSGTFLVTAIQKIKSSFANESPGDLLNRIVESVRGFDVNPIAVMTARLNYLLSVLDLLRETRGGVKIPVYLCDSVKLPREGQWDESFYELELPLDEPFKVFRVPRENPLTVLGILEKHVGDSFENFNQAVSQNLGQDFGTKYRQTLRNLHTQISKMEEKGVNGIWCRIIENFFAPLLLPPSDFVVGNPPWVSPENVAKEYRDSVNMILSSSGYLQPYEPKFVISKAKFPKAEAQYVACLPFMTRTTQRYLKPDGIGSFLLTSSLLKSLNAGGFRESMLKGSLTKILDLSLYTTIHEGALCYAFAPIFKNASGSINDTINYQFYIPTGQIRSSSQGEEEPVLLPQFWELNKSNMRLDTNDMRSPWFIAPPRVIEIFRKMQRLPLVGNQYRINMGIKPAANDIFFIETIEKSEGDLLLCTNQAGEKYSLERDLIYPLVRGRDIGFLQEKAGKQKQAWGFSHIYIVLPHDPRNTWKPFPEHYMRQKKEAWDYFMKEPAHLRKLKARTDWSEKKGPPYMLFRISPIKMNTFKVGYGDTSTRLSACVIPQKIEDKMLGKKHVVVDGTADIITIQNEDEAHYVCSMLNSTPLRTFAYTISLAKGSVPFRRFTSWMIASLPIPRFTADSDTCKELVKLSRQAHNAALERNLSLLAERVGD